MPFGLYLAETTPVSADSFQSILDALTAQISVTSIVGVLASVIGAGIGLVFMWWGVRKLIHVIMAAFKKGKLSV